MKGYGVIDFAGELIVYEAPDFDLSFGSGYALLAAAYSARRLGDERKLAFSAALHDAIEADVKHQAEKLRTQ